MRPRNFFQYMSSPSFEAQNEADEKNHNEPPSREISKFASSSAGDIVVVEPSFDESDGRGPSGDRNPSGMESRSSPLSEKKSTGSRGHSRNLSEHFYDATTLTNKQTGGAMPYSSSATGQKHRRSLSGDGSNPPEAHRRINSIGNSASVRRQDYRQERQHQRVDSALDILTAAADVSREELAMAAGDRTRGQRNPWDAPSGGSIRRSPVQMVTYDHGAGGAQQPPPPPPPPTRGHHMPYPAGPPPPPYYGAPIQYHQHPSQHPYSPPPAYYPGHPHPSHPHPSHGYPPRQIPPHQPHQQTSGYPVQYSRPPDPYSKSAHFQLPLQQQTMERPTNDSGRIQSSPHAGYNSNDQQEKIRNSDSMTSPPPPVTSSHWQGQGGTTQGVQTFVTSIGVGDGGRTLHSSMSHRKASNPEAGEAPPAGRHHRKTSSLSSLVFLGDAAENTTKGHHRSTSSSVSFLQGLEVGLEGDASFLHHLQASTGATASGYSTKQAARETKALTQVESPPSQDDSDSMSKLAPGGTSKRVRRKCTMDRCPNRVVQGGLCISHGAKRKLCRHAGCDKNVKKAGLCSTHGPARKRCDDDGCNKVAVQGGRCIAHGAKKKLCAIDSCAKQAILGGMCKKHHDQSHHQNNRIVPPPPVESFAQCITIGSGSGGRSQSRPPSTKLNAAQRKRTHTRGLSIFQEMSADTVGNLLLANPEEAADAPAAERHGSSYTREFGIY